MSSANFAAVLPSYLNTDYIQSFIRQALAEDLGDLGDVTSLASLDKTNKNQAYLKCKANGILAGMTLAKYILAEVDPEIQYQVLVEDGASIVYGQELMTLEGPTQSILKAERLLLNCMQRMSGIATKTNLLVQKLSGTSCKLLDTRKTTPLFRLFEKWAVKIGGGENHRIGLYDMILLKDNHIDASGGIVPALQHAENYRKSQGLDLKIEIETRTLEEVSQAIETGIPNHIMLDNMSLSDMENAVQLVNHRVQLEASGNISEENILQVAHTGVDFISMGALTHSYQSLDLSLKIRT